MIVAITSPSLDVNDNVSGISSIVRTIIDYNSSITYIHLTAGKTDNEKSAYKRFYSIIKSYIKLIKLLTKNSFDLLHLNLALNPKAIYRDFVTFKLCRLFNKNIIVHLHGGVYLQKKPKFFIFSIIRNILTNANKVVALSVFEKTTIENLYNISGVKILPNAVDTNVYQSTNARKNFDKLKFLFMGRLHKSKGIEIIINAFETLVKRGYQIELLICGNGPLKELVQRKAEENVNIKYGGTVLGKAKIDIMNECDIFLLPSLYGEGIPMALLEAMACGLVPIVSKDGSMKYIIKDYANGFLVKKNSVPDLVDKMEKVIKEKSLLNVMATNAIDTVTSNFGITDYLHNLNGLYENSQVKMERLVQYSNELIF
jgi:glycosyltransferase involved in cell wall biosynthesis